MLKILQVSPDGNNWALILGSEDQGVWLGEANGMTGRMVGVWSCKDLFLLCVGATGKEAGDWNRCFQECM